MKKSVLFTATLLTVLVFCGCCIQHDWQEANCQAPKTCVKCEKTEGQALPHQWAEATCESPKTCSTCEKTEGVPLGHDWQAATCEKTKFCARCERTEGEPLGHSWVDEGCEILGRCDMCGSIQDTPRGHIWKAADYERAKTCSECNKTEGEPLKNPLIQDQRFSFTPREFMENFSHLGGDFEYEYVSNKGKLNCKATVDGMPIIVQFLRGRQNGSLLADELDGTQIWFVSLTFMEEGDLRLLPAFLTACNPALSEENLEDLETVLTGIIDEMIRTNSMTEYYTHQQMEYEIMYYPQGFFGLTHSMILIDVYASHLT